MTHLVIKTNNYILLTSDEEIKEGDYHVATRIVETNGDKAIAFTDEKQLKAISEIGGAKKIIAHLPLNNSPILDGVDLLPPLPMTFPTIECIGDNLWEELTGGQEVSVNRADWSFGFGIGYKKAKEKYKFTEEDIDKAYRAGMQFVGEDKGSYKEFIQSISQSKLPTHFQPQYERWDHKSLIINGVMQGEWIFE